MIRTEMLLEVAGGRSAIAKQAPVPLITECALLRRKRTSELTNRIPSLLRSSPWTRDREPRCALRSDDTDARREARRCFGRSDRRAPPKAKAKLPEPPARTLKRGKPGWRPRSASAVGSTGVRSPAG